MLTASTQGRAWPNLKPIRPKRSMHRPVRVAELIMRSACLCSNMNKKTLKQCTERCIETERNKPSGRCVACLGVFAIEQLSTLPQPNQESIKTNATSKGRRGVFKIVKSRPVLCSLSVTRYVVLSPPKGRDSGSPANLHYSWINKVSQNEGLRYCCC